MPWRKKVKEKEEIKGKIMIQIKHQKPDYLTGEAWVVWNTKTNSGDLVPTLWDAIKYTLWYMGIPFRWLYPRLYKKAK